MASSVEKEQPKLITAGPQSNPPALKPYPCRQCTMIFRSGSALGGHMRAHRIDKNRNCKKQNCTKVLGGHSSSHKKLIEGCSSPAKPKEDSTQEMKIVPSDDSRVEANEPPKKKAKVYVCTICLRVFTSSQALGGHKRRHWPMQKSNDAIKPDVIVELPTLLDLFPMQPLEVSRSTGPTHVVPLSFSNLDLNFLTIGPNYSDARKENMMNADHHEDNKNVEKNKRKLSFLNDDGLPDDWLHLGIGFTSRAGKEKNESDMAH